MTGEEMKTDSEILNGIKKLVSSENKTGNKQIKTEYLLFGKFVILTKIKYSEIRK